jgi:hypothetical protein
LAPHLDVERVPCNSSPSNIETGSEHVHVKSEAL